MMKELVSSSTSLHFLPIPTVSHLREHYEEKGKESRKAVAENAK